MSGNVESDGSKSSPFGESVECPVLAAKRRQRRRRIADSKFRSEESDFFSRQDVVIGRVKALAVVGGTLWQ